MIPLGQLLAYQAARDPHRPAISCGSDVVTRRERERQLGKRP